MALSRTTEQSSKTPHATPSGMDKESTSRASQNPMLIRITVAIPTATWAGAGSACGCTRAGFGLSPARRGISFGAATAPRSARTAIAGCDVIRFFLHDRICCGIRPGAIDEASEPTRVFFVDAVKVGYKIDLFEPGSQANPVGPQHFQSRRSDVKSTHDQDSVIATTYQGCLIQPIRLADCESCSLVFGVLPRALRAGSDVGSCPIRHEYQINPAKWKNTQICRKPTK